MTYFPDSYVCNVVGGTLDTSAEDLSALPRKFTGWNLIGHLYITKKRAGENHHQKEQGNTHICLKFAYAKLHV